MPASRPLLRPAFAPCLIASLNDWSVWLSPWVLGAWAWHRLLPERVIHVPAVPASIHRIADAGTLWHESAAQLTDAAAMARVIGAPASRDRNKLAKASTLTAQKIEALPPLGLSKPTLALPPLRPPTGAGTRTCRSWAGCASAANARRARRLSPARYPIVEAATGIAVRGRLSWRFGAAQPTTLLWCGFVAALIALAMIDWDTTLLPDGHQPAAAVGRPRRRADGLDHSRWTRR